MNKISQSSSLKNVTDDILLDVSWVQISTKYFGKPRTWLNTKINA